MGLNNLADIFKEQYYQALDGGILEAFGVLFKDNVKIYAYPIEHENFEHYRKQIGRGDNVEAEVNEDGLVTTENLMVAQISATFTNMSAKTVSLKISKNCNRTNMRLFSRDVFERCKPEAKTERMPTRVYQLIEKKGLWKS